MIYSLSDSLSAALNLSSSQRADILLVAPKTLQALVGALNDYYTYKLAQHVYGKRTYPALCALLLTAGSAWNWFMSTRTFSNCIETTLTVIALYNWPYHWALGADETTFQVDEKILRIRQPAAITPSGEEAADEIDETTRLRRALFCAATAVVLRPTNAVVWLTLVLATFGRGMWHHGIHWEINAFIREGFLCGSIVLTLSALVDRVFYGVWTFPIWHFFKFNVLQSLAVFYGNNDWHYYLSQGYPLLLTAAIIPAVAGLVPALSRRKVPSIVSIQSRLILHRLALVSLVLPAALSILSHKEVRFIYPVLPALHVIAALPLARMLGFPDIVGKARISSWDKNRVGMMTGVSFLALTNTAIAVYFSFYHNSGLITLTNYFRNEFDIRYQINSTVRTISTQPQVYSNLTFAILMPCHSIPWRSHIQYPATNTTSGISGWALTCEPPLDLTTAEKATYKDEADLFYLNPNIWFKQNMVPKYPPLAPSPGIHAADPAAHRYLNRNRPPVAQTKQSGTWMNEAEGGEETGVFRARKRNWPDYLVFFGQMESTMKRVIRGSGYVECQRFWNSFFHDDWRRTGDVVVWCLPQRGNRELLEKRD